MWNDNNRTAAVSQLGPVDAPPVPVLESIGSRLESVFHRLADYESRTRNIADRVFGCQPSNIAPAGTKESEPVSTLARLELTVKHLELAADLLGNQAQRFERL